MSKVLLVDNFDSFTYNLYQYLGEIADEVEVVRNNQIPMNRLENGEFTHIVISPGPGNPTDKAYFGQCSELISKYHGKLPVLGICLGHQGIGAEFGGEIVRANKIMHGKTSLLEHTAEGLFKGLPKPLQVMRYHSLVVKQDTLPEDFAVDATAEDGSVMAIRHKKQPTFGIQFHPESFATPNGMMILKNFIMEKLHV